MKKIFLTKIIAGCSACLLTATGLHAQQQTLDSLKTEIEKQGTNLPAMRQYISLSGFPNDAVTSQFDTWMKQFPKSSELPFALGEAYYQKRDSRKSINYLIKSAQLQEGKNERLSKMIGVARDESWALDIPRTPNTIDSLKKIIESRPDSSLPIKQYLFVMGNTNDTAVAQLNAWMKQFPQAVTFPMSLGEAYYNEESPKAKPYLLKVVELQPKNAAVWQMLSIDAERWGNNNLSREYMGKAAEAAPNEPSYSFYHAMDYEHVDKVKWKSMLYDLAKRFPESERGAQGLYWLGFRTTDPAGKIKAFEDLRRLYSPEKFSWSSSGMSGLYDAYILQNQPEKAKELAVSMGKAEGWSDKAALADNVMTIQKLVKEKKYKDAYTLLDKLKTPRYSSVAADLAVLRSKVTDASGNTQAAYDSLVSMEAKTPDDDVRNELASLGSKLGKNVKDIEKDIWAVREKTIKAAPDFNLGLYTSGKTASLADYKGKVVLMTFWFPGCGPCRGEFPHFESVLKKFKGKEIVYLGINVFPEQDDYVLPFMQGTKYSFIPLRGTAEWAAKAYKVRGEPTNFLIDGEGRIVFSNF
ncbi:MAG: redoxin domain-containing protein, partial [Bacteroidetes bacterium]|nr:redoxin domain-containing protein [Bacteroidota bacterium]